MEHLISQLLYKPWEMFLALKSPSSGQPSKQGPEGGWGCSTGHRQRTPLQPLCPLIQVGRVMEQGRGPGTLDPEQPAEVETGEMRVKETEELL